MDYIALTGRLSFPLAVSDLRFGRQKYLKQGVEKPICAA